MINSIYVLLFCPVSICLHIGDFDLFSTGQLTMCNVWIAEECLIRSLKVGNLTVQTDIFGSLYENYEC